MFIKAIETKYKGYRFRSRLEARWAVFFDALKLDWEYEKEGFEMQDDGRYLPDFWVSDWQTWVEIKSSAPERGYLLKPTAFADRGEPLLLICGDPWPEKYYIDNLRGFASGDHHLKCFLAECWRCNGFCLIHDEGWSDIGHHTCEDHDKWPTVTSRIKSAFESARSARFEHGETPR